MGNTPRLSPHPDGPAGDMGLGLCLACCNLHAAGELKTFPAFAVTMAPIPTPTGQVIVLPTCYPCLKKTITDAGKPSLMVPR